MPAYFDKGLMVGQSAWHKEGTVIAADDDRRFDIAACIELADMDDEILLADCYYLMGENGEHCAIVPDRKVTVRQYADGTLKPMGTVGNRYKPLQPRQAFEWFQPWLETREVSIETAGTLQDGCVDWVMARILRDNMNIGGDEVAKYLMLSTRHDGGGSTWAGFTPQRVVCSNTLAMAHGSSASKFLRVRHTAGQDIALSTIRETINLIDQEFNATADQYRALQAAKVNKSDLRAYVLMVNGLEPEATDKQLTGHARKRVKRMIDLALRGAGQSLGDLNVWAAYNGVTEYVSHHYGSDTAKRATSLMDGAAADLNRRAFDLAIQLAS